MRVHVINLDRDRQRWDLFCERNAVAAAFERFSAIDGHQADRAALRRDGVVAPTLTYNNGQLGCALSHIALWRMAVAESRAMTILEDDAILAADFATASAEVARRLRPDWNIVLWGWNFDRAVWAEIPEGVGKSVLTFDQDALRNRIEVFRGASVGHAPIRLRHAFGSLAYSVTPAGAAALLDACLPLERQFIRFDGFGIGIPNNGIDCMMNLVYPKLPAYVCLPPLAVSENRHEISHTNRNSG